ncbi:DUF1173 domain-containing protein [Mesorhizobium sp. M1060]|uniref:hypothetical protein n=1 Tax=Mesorhizobium sp. M1060 TaxID=2957052 RepID=UPI003334DB5E
MILVGEDKELAPARSGHKLIVKHMPGSCSCWTRAVIVGFKFVSKMRWRCGVRIKLLI